MSKKIKKMDENLTGYGPASTKSRLIFDGDEAKYELWEVRFLGFMRTKKLHKIILSEKEGGTKEADIPADQNEDAFAVLCQYLDDRSLSLIIRDARDNGRKALSILRNHYKSNAKIIALYTELTSLKMGVNETCTDFIIRLKACRSTTTHS